MVDAYEAAVRAVPHRACCDKRVWEAVDGSGEPAWPNDSARQPCTCDRDARIARGMEAGAEALLLARTGVQRPVTDAAFLAAFKEASRG